MTDFAAIWSDLVAPLSEVIRRSARSMAFFHLPKTGGTSASIAIASAPGWRWVALPPADDTAAAADLCGHLAGRTAQGSADESVAVGLPHETYDAIRWLDSALRECGTAVDVTWMPVRPVRARLASAFTDYWTQVLLAQAHAEGTGTLDDEWAAVTRGYLLDSQHYRHGSGRIDGRAWFRAFEAHGAGVPFFLSEVFDDGPEAMVEQVRSGRLRVTPTTGIDAAVLELTGRPPARRRRVSTAASDPAVQKALASASREMDRLAARDAGFDRALAELMDDPSFTPGRGPR